MPRHDRKIYFAISNHEKWHKRLSRHIIATHLKRRCARKHRQQRPSRSNRSASKQQQRSNQNLRNIPSRLLLHLDIAIKSSGGAVEHIRLRGVGLRLDAIGHEHVHLPFVTETPRFGTSDAGWSRVTPESWRWKTSARRRGSSFTNKAVVCRRHGDSS